MLQTKRPLLIPGPWKPQRLVPGRELHGPGARILRERDTQHAEQNAIDVVLRLLFGEPQRVHLHAIAEQPELGIGNAVAIAAKLIPDLRHRTQLADLGDESCPGVHEEAYAPNGLGKLGCRNVAARLCCVEYRHRSRQGKGCFLNRLGSRLLQMVRAQIDRVPFRHLSRRERDNICRETQRWLRRENVSPASEILLDDIVLCRAGEGCAWGVLLIRYGHIKRE